MEYIKQVVFVVGLFICAIYFVQLLILGMICIDASHQAPTKKFVRQMVIPLGCLSYWYDEYQKLEE